MRPGICNECGGFAGFFTALRWCRPVNISSRQEIPQLSAPLHPLRHGLHASDLLDRSVHDRRRRRFRPFVPARPRRAVRAATPRSAVRAGRSRDRFRVRGRRAGLVGLSSGRPERAWRAFSQWRSSWLSREGVLSVATAIPARIFGIGWVFFGAAAGFFGLSGSWPPRRAGRHHRLHRHDLRLAEAGPSMAPSLCPYRSILLLALMAGPSVLDCRSASGPPAGPDDAPAGSRSLAAWLLKETYWRDIDTSFGAEPPRAPSRSAAAAASACWTRHTPRSTTCCMKWASASPASTAARLRRLARIAGFALPGDADPGRAVSCRPASAPSLRCSPRERGVRPGHRALAVLRRGQTHRHALLRG